MSETKLQVPEHVAIILDGNGRWAEKTSASEKSRTCCGKPDR